MKSEIKCLVCHSTKVKLLFPSVFVTATKKGNPPVNAGDYYRCLDCGVMFKDLDSLPMALSEYYKGVDSNYFGGLNASKRRKEQKMMHGLIFAKIKQGTILDIGCGMGDFLSTFDSTWEKWGVEPSENTRKSLESFQIKTQICEFLDAKLPENYFDVVTMFDVAEHLTDPVKNFEKIKKILKPNGLVLFATPNMESAMAKLTGRYWRHFNTVEHIVFFSPKTLRRFLEPLGFTDFVSKEYDYSHSIKQNLISFFKFGFLIFKIIFVKMLELIEKILPVKLINKLPPFYYPVLRFPWFFDFFCLRATLKP